MILCGSRIKFYRLLAGMTQEELSELLEMDTSQYGKIERGKTNITLSTLQDISNKLGVSPNLLLTDED